MRTILFIIRKEFQQLFRDRRLLPMIFLSPVLQIALLGYAANMDVKDIPLAICDQDQSVESRALVSSFLQSGSFVAGGYLPDAAAAERSIESGKASLALVIPPGFGRSPGRTADGAPAAPGRRLGDPVRRHRSHLCHLHRLPCPGGAGFRPAFRPGSPSAAPGPRGPGGPGGARAVQPHAGQQELHGARACLPLS